MKKNKTRWEVCWDLVRKTKTWGKNLSSILNSPEFLFKSSWYILCMRKGCEKRSCSSNRIIAGKAYHFSSSSNGSHSIARYTRPVSRPDRQLRVIFRSIHTLLMSSTPVSNLVNKNKTYPNWTRRFKKLVTPTEHNRRNRVGLDNVFVVNSYWTSTVWSISDAVDNI